MRKQSKIMTAVSKVTGLVDRLTNSVATLQSTLWEAIGDLRKNVGDIRLRTQEGFQKVGADMDRAWSLAESRNSVHRKRADELELALQRFNARLSALEGEPKAAAAFAHLTGINGRIEILEGKTGMLSECIGAHNDRLYLLTRRVENLEDLRVLYSTPYALENGDTLVITTTKPDGQGERVSAKVYGPAAYNEHVRNLQGLTPGKLTAQDEAMIANGRGAAVEYVAIPERDAR